MSSLLQFPNPRRRREAACDWISKIDAGLSATDRVALGEWLAASPSHAKVLMEMSQLWDEMDVMAELSDLFPLERDAQPQPSRRWRWRPSLLVAAAVTGAAVLGWWALAGRSPAASSAPWQATAETYETAIGDQSSVQLVDGTMVMLNTNTRLDVRYSNSERTVILQRGEASFDVVHDAERPFLVYAGQRVVQAVGTVFNVQLGWDNEVEISVTEGRIRVSRRDDAKKAPVSELLDQLVFDEVISAGEAVTVQNDKSTVRELKPEDVDVELAWQRGFLIFRGEPLDAVLREVGRYTTVDFELADRDLASVRVGGYFRAGEIDGLLVALRDNFNIQAHRSGDHIILASN